MGERVRETFAVSRGEESFTFRKVSRPYHLYRQGSDQSLGSVGQRKFFSRTLHMNLPAEFERAAGAGHRHWLHTATVRNVRASEPADGIAEVCATVQAGRRVRAVALRVERHDGRWRCTRLHLG